MATMYGWGTVKDLEADMTYSYGNLSCKRKSTIVFIAETSVTVNTVTANHSIMFDTG